MKFGIYKHQMSWFDSSTSLQFVLLTYTIVCGQRVTGRFMNLVYTPAILYTNAYICTCTLPFHPRLYSINTSDIIYMFVPWSSEVCAIIPLSTYIVPTSSELRHLVMCNPYTLTYYATLDTCSQWADGITPHQSHGLMNWYGSLLHSRWSVMWYVIIV